MSKTKYTIGFLFKDGHVALIKKNRPEWQKGLLNGIGGHVEPGEDPRDTMIREFQEEAGATAEWEYFCTMVFDEALVYCFRSFSSVDVKSLTDEKVGWYPVDSLPVNVIDNINWLVPLALNVEDQMRQVEMIFRIPADKKLPWEEEVIHKITGALQAAEMMQGNTCHSHYAGILAGEIIPIIQDHAPLPASIQEALNTGDGVYRP